MASSSKEATRVISMEASPMATTINHACCAIQSHSLHNKTITAAQQPHD
jgi:hypothetical protein